MGRFAPGQSGNPSGRPKGAVTLRRYAEARTKSGRELVDQAMAVLKGEESNTVLWNGEPVEVPPSLKDKAEARTYLTKVMRVPLEPETDDGKDTTPTEAPMTERELELLRAPGPDATVHPIKKEEK